MSAASSPLPQSNSRSPAIRASPRTAPPGDGQVYGVFTPGYVDATEVPHVAVHADGSRVDIPRRDPDQGARTRRTVRAARTAAVRATPNALPLGTHRRCPQRRQGRQRERRRMGAHRRTSGAGSPTPSRSSRLRELLPETADLAVTRHVLPNLRAVNFVIEGILGAGRGVPGTIRPAGQGPRRMAAQPTHRHPGGVFYELVAQPRARATAKDGARVRRTRGAAARRRVGARPASCRASCIVSAGDAGLLGAGFPEAVGGGGGDGADALIICEEMHYAGAPGGVFASLFTCGIAVPHMIASGDQRLIDTYVRPTLRGEKIGSLAITEPGGGSDVGHLHHHGDARRRRLHRQRREDLHHLRRARRLRRHRGRAPADLARRGFADRRRQGHAGVRGDAASSTRWAGDPRTPPNCPTPTCGCPPRT